MFKVQIKRVVEAVKHPNADKLVLCKVNDVDYQMVSNCAKVGDIVVYFPIDSVLPEDLAKKLGLPSRRIKTIKLRGEFSQGFIVPVTDIFPNGEEHYQQVSPYDIDTDITGILNVVKYEPESVTQGSMVLRPLPDGVEKYDIENYQNAVGYHKRFDLVVITEKLEGTNFIGAKNFCCSHRRLIEGKENIYYRIWEKYGLDQLDDNVLVRGEIIGPKIQKNYYELIEPELRVFDVQVGGVYLPFLELNKFCVDHKLPQVPIVHLGHINAFKMGRDLVDCATGMSEVIDKLREGIVIKPLAEQEVSGFGRLILKIRSREYLEKTGA